MSHSRHLQLRERSNLFGMIIFFFFILVLLLKKGGHARLRESD